MRFPEWDGYADAVLRRVRFFPDRQKIREELGGHLEDAFEALTDGGMEEKEAAGRAVLEMGDSERLGRELNAAHNPVAGWIWLASKWLLIALLAISLFNGTLFYIPVAVFRSLAVGYSDSEELGEPAAVIEVGQSVELGNRTVTLDELRIYGDGTVEVRYRTLYSLFSRAQKWSWYPTYMRDDRGRVYDSLSAMRNSNWLVAYSQYRTAPGEGIGPEVRRLYLGSTTTGQELEFAVDIGDWRGEA